MKLEDLSRIQDDSFAIYAIGMYVHPRILRMFYTVPPILEGFGSRTMSSVHGNGISLFTFEFILVPPFSSPANSKYTVYIAHSVYRYDIGVRFFYHTYFNINNFVFCFFE